MSDVSSTPSRPTSPASLAAVDNLATARPYRFTWDPTTRRPGPESVSGTTEGRGGDDFGVGHPPLSFLNASNLSLTLGSLPNEWSSSRTGFHAISTVLNNPHKRQAPPKAHSSLPSVPPAELPRVRRKDFDSYLRSIGPEWERYEHNTQLGRDGQAHIDSNQWATPRNSMASNEPPTQPMTPSPLQGKHIPPLDSVPNIFFSTGFNLGDPRTFETVTEQDAAAALLSSHEEAFSDPLSLSHSTPLLEKFSHYADTVEQHLVREISLRSTSFFAALTNLHDLQSESVHCLDRISKLRAHLQDVDNKGARRGLEMVRKESKMANLGKVRDGVKMIHGVVEMTGVAKGLVNAGQWGEALGVIEEIEKMWEVEEPPTPETARPPRSSSLGPNSKPTAQNGNGYALSPLPATVEEDEAGGELERQQQAQPAATPIPQQRPFSLKSLHAFSALPTHLQTLTMQIAASLSSEFVQVLRNDLETRISGEGQYNSIADQGLRDRLKPLLLNLVRTKGLKEGMLSWREVVMIEIRGVMKKVLPGFDPEEDEITMNRESTQTEGRPGLANHLRTMEHATFVTLIQRIYRNLLSGVEGLQAQGTIIVQVLEAIREQLGRKITDIPALEEDLTDIVSSSAELSNTQAAKVISYRAEQHASLELPDFLTFFNDSWAFVVKCEVICRRMIVGLRGTVVGQAKLFLQSFHQTRLTHSAKLVEDEQWKSTEIRLGLQHIVDILVDSAIRDPPELVIKSDDSIFSPLATSFPSPSLNGSSATGPSFLAAMGNKSSSNGSGPTGGSAHHLRIEERSYYVVSATAEVLTLLVDYLRVVVNLSMLTTDTMSRVIEFLKAFNSRTCQVVLGAGAMRSAGLKNITAKHLALASQSLSIIFEIIPYVREMFRRHLNQKQAIMLVEFDKLKRDYQEHQNEIHSKLVAIMGDRLNAHIKNLKTIDWNVPKSGGGVNEYMQVLVKETVTLHKVLSRYLSAPVVEYVMTQVFAAINHCLSEEYGQIDLPHQEAKTRLLADAQYLYQNLSALKNVGTPTGMLETVVLEKPLPRTNVPSVPASPTPPTRSNTLTANQRLRGLLSAKPSNADKALPLPARTSTPPPVPPQTEKPQSPKPTNRNSVYGGRLSNDQLHSMGGGQLALSTSPPIQREAVASASTARSGFREVEVEVEVSRTEAQSGSEGPLPLPSVNAEGGPETPKKD